MGGVSTAIDTYAPGHSGDEQLHQDVINYFQKAGNLDDIKQNHTVTDIANIIIQNTMAFVMLVTVAIMAIVFILTLRLQDIKLKKQ